MSPNTLDTIEPVLLIIWASVFLFGIVLLIYVLFKDSNYRQREIKKDSE